MRRRKAKHEGESDRVSRVPPDLGRHSRHHVGHDGPVTLPNSPRPILKRVGFFRARISRPIKPSPPAESSWNRDPLLPSCRVRACPLAPPLAWALPARAPRPPVPAGLPSPPPVARRPPGTHLAPSPVTRPASPPARPAPPRSPRAPKMVRCCPVHEYWLLGKIRNYGN